jgi:hypothetical protein
MGQTRYRDRRAYSIENEYLEVTVTVEGGHIAAIRDKATGINPLWSPPWPTIEPSAYDRVLHPEYGDDAESKLLAGILGHNLCLDLFGGPSADEAEAGLTVHGEGSVAPYEITTEADTLTQRVSLETCGLAFERRIQLPPVSRTFTITETVENLSICDRPVAWTQHVTLGPPFLEKGKTRFEATATRSKVVEEDFTKGMGYMVTGAEFAWPDVPTLDGATEDLRTFTGRDVSGAFTTHLMDPQREQVWFAAWSPSSRLGIAYIWKRADFPWLGIWEENHSRTQPPWNGQTLTRGMEFGVSPFAESRRAMVERGRLFSTPTYRWIPARRRVTVVYQATVQPADSIAALGLP